MQTYVSIVDLVKSFPTNIFLQNLASIQKRTSPIKLAHLAEKSEKGSISNLSTTSKVLRRRRRRGVAGPPEFDDALRDCAGYPGGSGGREQSRVPDISQALRCSEAVFAMNEQALSMRLTLSRNPQIVGRIDTSFSKRMNC